MLSYVCMGYISGTLAIGVKQVNESTSLMFLNYSKIENKNSLTTSFQRSCCPQCLLGTTSIYPASAAIYFEHIVHLHFSYITKDIFHLHFHGVARYHFLQKFFLCIHLCFHISRKKLEANFSSWKLSNDGLCINSVNTLFLSRLLVIWHHLTPLELNTQY